MKTQLASLKLGAVVASLCMFAGVVFVPQHSVVGAQDKQVRPRFEYRVVFERDLLQLAPKDQPGIEGALNRLGEDGWDLVSVISDLRPARPGEPKVVVVGAPPERENRFYFKRQK
jgi:hypothetical protein